MSASPSIADRDARRGDSGSERDADRAKVDQRLALGGGGGGQTRLPETASLTGSDAAPRVSSISS